MTRIICLPYPGHVFCSARLLSFGIQQAKAMKLPAFHIPPPLCRLAPSALLLLLLLLLATGPMALLAQQAPLEEQDPPKKETALRMSGSLQLWLRYSELNPSSLVAGREESTVWDVFMRRYRLRATGRAGDKLRYTLELGNNDLSPASAARAMPHLLDAYADYQLTPFLALGTGKHAWGGPSRYSAPSTTQALGHDIDFIGAPLVNIHDDILRRWGAYARGASRGWDYRLALTRPYHHTPTGSPPTADRARFAQQLPPYQLSGYLKYQFLDREAPHSPYAPGTYLGTKRVLNAGLGSLHQPRTSWSLLESDTLYHSARAWATDLFYDSPLPGKRSLTVYLAFLQYDFGPNFMRYMGANNPASGGGAPEWVNGRGNAAPVIGSGHSWYLQLGYMRPMPGRRAQQLQCYGSLQYSQFEALSEPALLYNAGAHYLLNSHRSKLSLGYQSRPVFRLTDGAARQAMRKGGLVLQYQQLFGK
jgi:hypothetical protein